jgi:NADH dehydrogenase
VNKGYSVRAIVRRRSHSPYLIDDRVEIVYGDIRNRDFLFGTMRNVDIVVHLAAAKSDEQESHETNVVGTRNLREACEANDVSFIVHMSTMSTKIEKKGAYAYTKSAADEEIKEGSIPVTIIRPSVVYGPEFTGVFGSMLTFSRLPLVPMFGKGDVIFRPIHVDDLAEMIIRVIENKKIWGRDYDAGGKEKISFKSLLRLIAHRITEKKHVRIVHVPASVGIAGARVLGMITSRPPITVSNILGSTQHVVTDSEKLIKESKFEPRTLESGLAELKERYRTRRELELLYRYLLPGCLKAYPLEESEIDTYAIALKMRKMLPFRKAIHMPLMLGFIDAVSKIFYKKSTLQKKLSIAFILLECSPRSAPFLLPQHRSVLSIIAASVLAGMSTTIKLIGGLGLMLIPGFVKNHVN